MITDSDTELNSQLIVMTCSRRHQKLVTFYIYILPVTEQVLVYWSDCPLSPGCNAVLFDSTAKRNSRTQKQWIET